MPSVHYSNNKARLVGIRRRYNRRAYKLNKNNTAITKEEIKTSILTGVVLGLFLTISHLIIGK